MIRATDLVPTEVFTGLGGHLNVFVMVGHPFDIGLLTYNHLKLYKKGRHRVLRTISGSLDV